jgi:3-methyl-2-oxobutanoate hydroxymethyltransferase
VSWITSYDAPTASLQEQAGIDMLLVGDSVGMCIYGYSGTNEMTMPVLLAHTAAVRRGAPNTFVIGDMPFLSYQISCEEAVANAGAFLRVGADAIKLEGGRRVANQIRAISDAGIVVFGHIGLTPQSSSQLGGFKAQGLTADSAKELLADADAVQEAGARFLLVEAVAPEVTQIIRQRLTIPVYGIGAGIHTDGELLIVSDLLGIFEAFKPKFVRRYANLATDMKKAFETYRVEVKDRKFPGAEHVYNMLPGELEKLQGRTGAKKAGTGTTGKTASRKSES